MNRPIALFFLLIIAAHFQARAQGCSDAGVCSAGPIGQLQLWQDSTADIIDYRHFARSGFSYAIGEQGTTIMQTNMEISLGIGLRLALQAKVPYIWTSGDLGENHGIGDAIVTSSYAFVKERDRNLAAMFGVRLPTGSTTATAATLLDGEMRPMIAWPLSLPMPYQTGLGTTDLLMGVNARRGRWTIALAYQHVINNANTNRFTHGYWFNDERAVKYFESFFLERKDDAVARVQYAYGCGRLALQPGLIGIYHVGEDTKQNDYMTTANQPPGRSPVQGSQGLTLNVTLDLRYKLTEQWAIEAVFGAPVVTREVRPDGLTRSLVTGFGLRYRF